MDGIEDGQEFFIRIHLDTDANLSPSEWRRLIDCLDEFTKAVARRQAYSLLDEIGASREIHRQARDAMHSFFRRPVLPIEITSIKRGSWSLEAAIPYAIGLWVLKNTIGQTIKDAYQQSSLRNGLMTFLRGNVFGKARQAADQYAERKSRFGNLTVSRIEDTTDHTSLSLTIHLQRSEIIPVRFTDQQLIEEFEDRLRDV